MSYREGDFGDRKPDPGARDLGVYCLHALSRQSNGMGLMPDRCVKMGTALAPACTSA